MSHPRSTFFVAIGGCLFGAMIPLLLGAAQPPEKQFPRYSVSGSGEHMLLVVDNQKDELHVYSGIRGRELHLSNTIDLSQIGHTKIQAQNRVPEDELKRLESSPKSPK